MSKGTRDWSVSPTGDLSLSLSVLVNGKKLTATATMSADERYFSCVPPPRYVERDLRRQLMAAVEDTLLGPLPK